MNTIANRHVGPKRPFADTPEHVRACDTLRARLLPIMGVEIPSARIARECSVPTVVMARFVARTSQLPAHHHAAVEAWIEARTAVKP